MVFSLNGLTTGRCIGSHGKWYTRYIQVQTIHLRILITSSGSAYFMSNKNILVLYLDNYKEVIGQSGSYSPVYDQTQLKGGGQTFFGAFINSELGPGGPIYGPNFWRSFWTSAPNQLRATPRPNMEPKIAISPRWS